jgi:uncharacterized membrane protein
VLWSVYFVAMVAVSATIYLLAPWPWWSLFCNLITPVAAGSLFVGEYFMRYWRHPDFERVTLAATVRAYRQATQTTRADGAAPR